MAHKTFISYKYSESVNVRDRIIESLGEDATYYNGEKSDSPDLTDTSTENIRTHLKDMLYDTSVTIVVLSPHMNESNWIDWEIEYSLKRVPRNGRVSQTNGVVGVIKKVDGGYGWFRNTVQDYHGNFAYSYNFEKVFPIIKKNCFNSNPPQKHCSKCDTYDYWCGSYITLVDEDAFCNDPQSYIDNAYDKSKNDGEGYDLVRKR